MSRPEAIERVANSRPEAAESGSHPVLSLLLFFHLFCVAVALSGNHFPSALQIRLIDLFAPYLRSLNFDLNYTPYHLTLGTIDDQDHRIEVLPAGGDEQSAEAWLGVPDKARRGERYRRYQRLAAAMGFFGERQQNNQSALFAGAVAEHFLHQRQITPAQIRCRRILPQDRNLVAGGTAEDRNPWSERYFSEVYRANTVVGGGSVSVIKVEEAGQVARPGSGGQ
jgi:hypothetical protein